ncbi:sulfate adenylyltransferase subunit CysN [Methylopila musalis]|uniref:Multifunctional fusion protein n=1 Tax=Methylopila musalis TaxID=1134781 RepID=A0ABW3Z5K6_9HYPH
MHAPLTTAELAGAAAEKTLLRFLTCGSVDDGKSTLIGRLLYDTKLVFDDQLAALEKDSRKHGTVGEAIDLALLVDGLEAEREQGITIDVAYRYFATAKRTFIVADTPGHEQYTRNMATGASNADLAVILIDARKGVLTQTKRHSFICSLLGIRHVVLAVNKIDLVDYSEARFQEIEAEYRAFAEPLGFETITPIPLSARDGDNVTSPSPRLGWHRGPTLLAHLETVDVETDLAAKPFRFPVQWVNRPNLDFRGFAGTIASGTVRPGDEVVVAASGKTSRVARIVTMDGDLASASAGDSVTLTLEDEVDIARGDLLARPAERPEVSNQFAARLIWMQDERLLPGRSYLIKLATRTVPATVTTLKHKIDVNTLEKLAAKTLGLNEIAEVNVETGAPVAFDPYADNRETGAFIVIDRETNATAGAGMVLHGLRRATNIHRHASSVDRTARARLKNQTPAIVWFTGLSASGKSTIANLVEAKLAARGQHTMLLDGDNVRFGLNKDLGFTDADRVENVRRIGEVAKLFTDAGVIALCSFISPFESERRMVRDLVADGEFIEVFVDTPLETCIARDPKGLYKRALAGEIPNFTGVSSPYEAPKAAELTLPTVDASVDDLADRVIAELERRGLIDAV